MDVNLPSLLGIDLGDDHILNKIPEKYLTEIEQKIKNKVFWYCKSYNLDPDDLYQSIMCDVVRKFRVGDSAFSILNIATFACKEFLSREMDWRKESKIARYVDSSEAKDYPCLQPALTSLSELEKKVFDDWVDGKSLDRIRMELKLRNSGAARGILIEASKKIAEHFGETLRLESMFPAINRILPKGIYLSRGKYTAKAFKNGKKMYLGTFLTLQEAVQALKDYENSEINLQEQKCVISTKDF